MSGFQVDDFIAGWVGGAASVIVGHPLDTVKTHLQAGHGYRNTLHCILTIYRNENATGFFKGMSFPLASIAVYNSVVFGIFSNVQRLITQYRCGQEKAVPTLSDVAFASMVTGLISVGIGCPVDLVKIRLQMQTAPTFQANVNLASGGASHKNILSSQTVYRGPIDCIRSVLRKEGICGMYRGAGAMIFRDVPGYCLYFIPYSLLCYWFTPEDHSTPSALSVWLAGGISGAISWGTATPMDVVKSRLQSDGVCQNKYNGVKDCIIKSYHNEGMQSVCQTNSGLVLH
ncbi:solute carrier family 25 member 48 [Protopterus annectens]|uniref:solute carrier family 25 member 48 n=1 Tax=Protopterus annectens TaxID=7888 RepID=UPI001CFAFEA6|nr:solute carrier family 25 member 48 [Protopterus annectens]